MCLVLQFASRWIVLAANCFILPVEIADAVNISLLRSTPDWQMGGVSDLDAPCFEHHREVYLFKFLALPLDYKAPNLRQRPFSVLGTPPIVNGVVL
jgi:hypothetical protein